MNTQLRESTAKETSEPRDSGREDRGRRPSISAKTNRVRTGERLYACGGCGNLVVADDRPRRCLNCRRGVSDYRLEELYTQVAIVKVVG